MDAINAIQRIQHDFEERQGPYSDVTFPEERLLDEAIGPKEYASMEERLRLLSAFAMLDYNRDANQLTDNLLELLDGDSSLFNPYGVGGSVKVISQRFTEIGFRYPNRDAKTWVENNRIVQENYHGEWTELLLGCGTDATAIVNRLTDDDFRCLKGDKIALMYVRFIDQYVCDLDNVWQLEIPVDTHIRKLSMDLFHEHCNISKDRIDDDCIRRKWRAIAQENDIERHVVDGALWQIGNNWSEWGKDYWQEVTP